MPWLYLAAAIAFEVCGTTCLKLSAGFTRPIPSGMMFVSYAACFACLTLAVRGVPLGTAYAIWSGAGTAAILLLSRWLFGESLGPAKLAAVGLILAGVVWLRLLEHDPVPIPPAGPPGDAVRS